MKKLLLIIIVTLMAVTSLTGCNGEQEENSAMKFEFESLDFSEYSGGTYLMDFGELSSQEDAAIVEGKLLTVFGNPAEVSENYENSFNYFIRATASDGRSTVLNVYGMGVIHIGASQGDDFTMQAGKALVEYVNAAKPTDYERTVYYLDYDLQIDIKVEDCEVTIKQSQISEEKTDELFDKWYK